MTYTDTIIAGCGNPLFGDDGFGPAVAEELQIFSIPAHVMAIDAGTSAPELVFPLIDPVVTKKIIIIDIVDFGAEPGSIVLLRPGDFPHGGLHDAHKEGIISSLGDIRTGIEVLIVGCQPGHVPYPYMEIGLSDKVRNAIPNTIRVLCRLIGGDHISSTKDYPVYLRGTGNIQIASCSGTDLPYTAVKPAEEHLLPETHEPQDQRYWL
jgi:coenzyme F420 hydrogenase subunit delta